MSKKTIRDNVIDAAELVKDTALNTSLALDIAYIKADLAEIKAQLDNKYVTKDEFATVRSLVYGCASLVLTSFMLALTYLVIK